MFSSLWCRHHDVSSSYLRIRGHDLGVPGGIEESHEAEVALHEEDVIEALEIEVQEEVEADHLIIAINEEKEAFHQEGLQV